MLQLLRDLDLSPQQEDYARTAEEAATSLLNILGDILDVSKIEAGKIELERRPFSLRRLVDECVRLFEAPARTRGLRLTLQADGLPTVMGDEGRLRQVLVNLIGNALKFTPAGGVEVAVIYTEAGATFRVTDTGIGISPDAQTRLFSPFMQADTSMTRRFGGTGLGLAISSHLVALMGGQLTVTSQEGQGSTFAFAVALPACATTPVETPSPQARGLEGHVLLVEDHPVSQKVAQGLLARLGLRTTVASNGREALHLLEQEPFDLVLMDCQMPVLDGYEATQLWRATEAARGLPRTPVLALTANALADEEDACRQAGMDGFLSKPVHREVLAERLAPYLGHRA